MLLKITMLMYLILADQTAVIAAVEQVGKLVTAIISTEIATAILSKVMEKKQSDGKILYFMRCNFL